MKIILQLENIVNTKHLIGEKMIYKNYNEINNIKS